MTILLEGMSLFFFPFCSASKTHCSESFWPPPQFSFFLIHGTNFCHISYFIVFCLGKMSFLFIFTLASFHIFCTDDVCRTGAEHRGQKLYGSVNLMRLFKGNTTRVGTASSSDPTESKAGPYHCEMYNHWRFHSDICDDYATAKAYKLGHKTWTYPHAFLATDGLLHTAVHAHSGRIRTWDCEPMYGLKWPGPTFCVKVCCWSTMVT